MGPVVSQLPPYMVELAMVSSQNSAPILTSTPSKIAPLLLNDIPPCLNEVTPSMSETSPHSHEEKPPTSKPHSKNTSSLSKLPHRSMGCKWCYVIVLDGSDSDDLGEDHLCPPSKKKAKNLLTSVRIIP
jgi:hypothetical protein